MADQDSFDWIPFYEELADKLVAYRTRQADLINLLEQLREQLSTVTPLEDRDAKGRKFLLTEIDPFTFFGTFNRDIKKETRIEILEGVKRFFSVEAAVPTAFTGVPVLPPQNSWFFSFKSLRKPDDIDRLWEVFGKALETNSMEDPAFEAAFDRALEIRHTKLNLTMGLFWIRPRRYLSLDGKMRDSLRVDLPKSGLDFQFYKATLQKVLSDYRTDLPHLSHEAHLARVGDQGHAAKVEHPSKTSDELSGAQKYWWINANPTIWDFAETPVGGRQTYTSHNERGNKRRIFKYFQEVKPGDLVVGYVTSPDREVVAICRVTKPLGLHDPDETESIEFEKVEQLVNPVPLLVLQKDPALKESEPVIGNQGSLFRLTPDEFAAIRSHIDDLNPSSQVSTPPFSKKQALEDLFLAEDQMDEMLRALGVKKNIILQGAPGVGKTFVAKKLAYALIGAIDPNRVQMIQFHQSYSYEDFIQGFRPTESGQFELKNGVFFQFCRKAQRDPQNRPFVFVIDEINRGNLRNL